MVSTEERLDGEKKRKQNIITLIVFLCLCNVVCSGSRKGRPYALIENVVTHEDHRQNGYAGQCLEYAKKIAEKENCYKMMLMTGSKDPKVFLFYGGR